MLLKVPVDTPFPADLPRFKCRIDSDRPIHHPLGFAASHPFLHSQNYNFDANLEERSYFVRPIWRRIAWKLGMARRESAIGSTFKKIK